MPGRTRKRYGNKGRGSIDVAGIMNYFGGMGGDATTAMEAGDVDYTDQTFDARTDVRYEAANPIRNFLSGGQGSQKARETNLQSSLAKQNLLGQEASAIRLRDDEFKRKYGSDTRPTTAIEKELEIEKENREVSNEVAKVAQKYPWVFKQMNNLAPNDDPNRYLVRAGVAADAKFDREAAENVYTTDVSQGAQPFARDIGAQTAAAKLAQLKYTPEEIEMDRKQKLASYANLLLRSPAAGETVYDPANERIYRGPTSAVETLVQDPNMPYKTIKTKQPGSPGGVYPYKRILLDDFLRLSR